MGVKTKKRKKGTKLKNHNLAVDGFCSEESEVSKIEIYPLRVQKGKLAPQRKSWELGG